MCCFQYNWALPLVKVALLQFMGFWCEPAEVKHFWCEPVELKQFWREPVELKQND